MRYGGSAEMIKADLSCVADTKLSQSDEKDGHR
jgi:hypothetical protein